MGVRGRVGRLPREGGGRTRLVGGGGRREKTGRRGGGGSCYFVKLSDEGFYSVKGGEEFVWCVTVD